MSETGRPIDRAMRMGHTYVFEYAMRADGSYPARDFLRGLKAGSLPEDPDSQRPPPDPDQISDYDWFLNEIGAIARDGEPRRRRAINYLSDGIWELKRGSKRLTFYDTDGSGGYIAKPPITDPAMSSNPDSALWFFPDFAGTIRLGHWFYKQGEKASPGDIQEAEDVRREDLDHDRPIQ